MTSTEIPKLNMEGNGGLVPGSMVTGGDSALWAAKGGTAVAIAESAGGPLSARVHPRKGLGGGIALGANKASDGSQTARAARTSISSPKKGGQVTPLVTPKGPSSRGGERSSRERVGTGESWHRTGSGTEVAPTPKLPPGPGEGPITPATALRNFAEYLTDYEQGEILEYKQVYFLGKTRKKVQASTRASNNCGFDDDRGDYTIVMHDHIAYRFEILSMLGKGSFGQVVKCLDYKTNQLVALKLIRNKKRFHHQALVEVKILSHLKTGDPTDSTNIIRIKDSFYFRHHLCITFPLLSINLYEFIKNNKFRGVSLGLIRRFAIQILSALRFLRKQRIVHCDLKPENILLKQPNKSGIKVIDFGSSCFSDERVYTYIQSRFYRSPEVILGLPYTTPIDMWSFGTILAELFTGYPLFPGENEVEQLLCIMEVLDVPPARLLDAAPRRNIFFDSNGNPRIVANSRGKKRRPRTKSLRSVLRCNDPLFIDFLTRCLSIDPDARMTPNEALKHEWIMEATVPMSAVRLPRHRSSDSRSSKSGGSGGGRRHKRRSHHKSSRHGHGAHASHSHRTNPGVGGGGHGRSGQAPAVSGGGLVSHPLGAYHGASAGGNGGAPSYGVGGMPWGSGVTSGAGAPIRTSRVSHATHATRATHGTHVSHLGKAAGGGAGGTDKRSFFPPISMDGTQGLPSISTLRTGHAGPHGSGHAGYAVGHSHASYASPRIGGDSGGSAVRSPRVNVHPPVTVHAPAGSGGMGGAAHRRHRSHHAQHVRQHPAALASATSWHVSSGSTYHNVGTAATGGQYQSVGGITGVGGTTAAGARATAHAAAGQGRYVAYASGARNAVGSGARGDGSSGVTSGTGGLGPPISRHKFF